MGKYGYYSGVRSFNGGWVTRADLLKRLDEDDDYTPHGGWVTRADLHTPLSALPLPGNQVTDVLSGAFASAQDQPKRRFRDDG